LLTRAEKERRVIELYEQDKTYREIAKEVHISLGDISYLVKRHTGQLRGKVGYGEQRQQEKTIDTQVFKLFEVGRTPVQVAIDSNLKSEEVTKLYKEWWQLKGLHELNQLYEEAKDNIFDFRKTCNFLKDQGYAPRQLIDAADHLDEMPLLRSEREQLMQENQNLAVQKGQLNESIAIVRQDLSTINMGVEFGREELRRLNHQKRQTQTVIASLQESAGYERIQGIADATARSILNQNKVVLMAALRAMLQALREEPRNELHLLIYGSLSYPLYEPRIGNRPQNYVQLRQALLFESAQEMYNDLLTKSFNNTMSSALGMTYDQPSFSFPAPT
jgi:hypothetical protein